MNEPSNFCSGDCDKPPVAPSNPDKFKFNPNFPPYQINNQSKCTFFQSTHLIFFKKMEENNHYSTTLYLWMTFIMEEFYTTTLIISLDSWRCGLQDWQWKRPEEREHLVIFVLPLRVSHSDFALLKLYQEVHTVEAESTQDIGQETINLHGVHSIDPFPSSFPSTSTESTLLEQISADSLEQLPKNYAEDGSKWELSIPSLVTTIQSENLPKNCTDGLP